MTFYECKQYGASLGLRRSLWCPAFLRGGMRTSFEKGGNVSRDGGYLACWEEDAIRKHMVFQGLLYHAGHRSLQQIVMALPPSRKICLPLVSSLSPSPPGSVCSKTWRTRQKNLKNWKFYFHKVKAKVNYNFISAPKRKKPELHPCPKRQALELWLQTHDTEIWNVAGSPQVVIFKCQFHASESWRPIRGVCKDSFQEWPNHFTIDGQTELANLESAVTEVWTKDGGKRHERSQLRDA